MEHWIDAAEAQRRLGVRPQTLYAYVSRGRLHADAGAEDPRRSRYRAAEVDALAASTRRSRKRRDVAESALAWGEPALISAVTTVADGRLFYRGQDAVRLAERITHEQTAALLRDGAVVEAETRRPAAPNAESAMARMLLRLAASASRDAPLAGRRGAALDCEAATLLASLADAITGRVAPGPLHARLAVSWGHEANDDAANAIRRTLVLLADHELNASAFAARVASSTGASLAASALAGLATLTGPRHGGAPAAIRRVLARAEVIGARAAIAERIADGGALPGFGHPLYANADPRAEALLARVTPGPALAALRDEGRDYAGLFPNVDFALIAVADAFALPAEAPLILFAAARAAGWIAHAVEQAESGVLIRPRARYVGLAVTRSDSGV